MLRTQKRQSIRSECQIYASMYMIRGEVKDFRSPEQDEGYKCLIEDISEDGAMIRIGGMGRNNVQIKIQFTLNDVLVIMYGVIRAVEYNKVINQSRLHFECVHIENDMKNAVLSYVYRVTPEHEREKAEALSLVEGDSLMDEQEVASKAEYKGVLVPPQGAEQEKTEEEKQNDVQIVLPVQPVTEEETEEESEESVIERESYGKDGEDEADGDMDDIKELESL